jgi:disulfide bond formation protein DsbB
MSRSENARWLALLVPAALLCGAYASQYLGGLFPCEMCWWQRYPHFAALILSVLAFATKGSVRTAFVALAALSLLASGLIGGFHAGVEYGWWPGLSSCTSAVSGTGEDLLKSIMNAPLVRCDVAPWDLFGISLAGYNFLISTLAAFAIFGLLSRKGTV